MTQNEFNTGYKLLIRFFKDQGYYNAFKKYTVGYNGQKQYKKEIFDAFNNKGIRINEYHQRMNFTWAQFFNWIIFLGIDFEKYGPIEEIDMLRKKWKQLLESKNIQY